MSELAPWPRPQSRPRTSCIDPKETVVFFPTAASRISPTHWHIPIHGSIYQPTELSRLRRTALATIQHLLRRRVPPNHPGTPLFQKRLGAFLADNERGNRVCIDMNGTFFTLKRSRPNGHFETTLKVSTSQLEQYLLTTRDSHATPAAQTSAWLPFHALTRPHDKRHFPGRALLLAETGLSVISDIDDTIKITEVCDRRRMLHNTFLREFVTTPGMAALYRRWQTTENAAFHYVSASPWHLYPFLADFLAANDFPPGTFHLRDFRLMPRDLLKTLRPSPRVKLRHARLLLKRFPKRRFILVGDSGESDATLYADLYRSHPTQIQKIYIRNVTQEPADAPRWKNIFAGIPSAGYQIFSTPAEISA